MFNERVYDRKCTAENHAGGGTRTHTPLRTSVFETDAYTIPPLQLKLN